MDRPIRRVAVIGPPGSGKSTLAARLAGHLGHDHVELDELFHQPGWVETPTPEFRRRVATRLADAQSSSGGWVVAGNYVMAADIVQGHADMIVWLDLGRRSTVPRVARRTFRRAATREELWNGNRETWRDALHPRRSMIAEAWRAQPRHRTRYEQLAQTPLWSGATVHRLRTPGEVTQFEADAR